MSQPAKVLEVKNLKTHFFADEGVVKAVNGVDLTLYRGRTLGILGESGCGKSQTGFSILNLIRHPGRIVAGSILYYRANLEDRIDLAALDPTGEEMRRIRGGEIGMVFQEPMTSLDPLYTIGDQIIEAIVYHRTIALSEARQIAVEMLDRVGMPQPQTTIDRYPHQLSGGMIQRAVIAMALSTGPKILIADEPTTALDVTTEAQILALMRDLQTDLQMDILFITHDLGVIAEMARDVIVMYLGEVVEACSIETLFQAPKHPYTEALLRSLPKLGQKTGERLETIQGMVPTARNIPSGCPFHPRCSQFMPGKCDVIKPKITHIEDGHQVRCLLYEDAYGDTTGENPR